MGDFQHETGFASRSRSKKDRASLILLLFAFSICFINISIAQNHSGKEFRGVWIATINNIDWPSAPGLSAEVQKSELKGLIERIKKLNLNVVIFQVRPASDAFYLSETEPWSYFLTGKQGTPPSPDFDPLGYAIELCHANGMELHAWFNPFRVRNAGFYKLDPSSFSAKHPQYIREYDHKLFLDPGIPLVREHINKVIMEVVRKYNIDAVHFDDYFYPYPGSGIQFPDQKTFHKYGKGYYPQRLGDWRRENINQLISAIHDSIKAVKPSVRLGISPFGIWRNKKDDLNGSPGVKGTTSFDNLYADVYKWLSNGWIDYVIPQLYWEQGNRFGDFAALVKWWNDHSFGKSLYIGQALFKSTGTEKVFENPKEINEQISILRKFGNVGGFAFYSASHLAKLSDAHLNELTLSILPPTAQNLNNAPSGITDQKQISLCPPIQFPENLFVADKKSLADTLNFRYKSLIDNTLETPSQISVTKSREGWEIEWMTLSLNQSDKLKYSIMIFKRVKGDGWKGRTLGETNGKKFLIPKKSDFNPAKVFLAIVTVNQCGCQSLFSNLFHIRGRRIILN